jgi:hypothetical protein
MVGRIPWKQGETTMRTYAVQFIADYGTFGRGEIRRFYEQDAVNFVNMGVAVWCVI